MKTNIRAVLAFLFFLSTFLVSAQHGSQSLSEAELQARKTDFYVGKFMLQSSVDFMVKIEHNSSEQDVWRTRQMLQLLGIDATIEYERAQSGEIASLKCTLEDGGQCAGDSDFGSLIITRLGDGSVGCGLKGRG